MPESLAFLFFFPGRQARQNCVLTAVHKSSVFSPLHFEGRSNRYMLLFHLGVWALAQQPSFASSALPPAFLNCRKAGASFCLPCMLCRIDVWCVYVDLAVRSRVNGRVLVCFITATIPIGVWIFFGVVCRACACVYTYVYKYMCKSFLKKLYRTYYDFEV